MQNFAVIYQSINPGNRRAGKRPQWWLKYIFFVQDCTGKKFAETFQSNTKIPAGILFMHPGQRCASVRIRLK